MPLFDIIFGAIFIGLWMALGIVPWLTLSIATRGNAGIGMLPLCMLAGIAGGMIVPFLGFTDVSGIWFSFTAALALPAGLLTARRFAASALSLQTPAAEAKRSPDTK
jgi:hypothetical protein